MPKNRSLMFFSTLIAFAWGGCAGESCPGGAKAIDGLCPCSDGSAQVNGECPCPDGTYPADNVGGTCGNGPACEPGYVEVAGNCRYECDDGSTEIDEFDCPFYFEPAAVGIEYLGGFQDGEWVSYNDVDSTGAAFEIPPLIVLRFADIEYFSGAGTYCEVFARVDEELSSGTSIPVVPGGTVWNSWDLALQLDAASWEAAIGDGPCNLLVDPALYGENGQDLFDAFDGMHLGIGFGPPTTNLVNSLNAQTGGPEFLADVGDGLFTQFTAINDAAGVWIGEDWAYGVSLEWDPTTNTVVRDETGLATIQDVVGTVIPNGALAMGSIWLQDFPLMDLSNLADGAPQ